MIQDEYVMEYFGSYECIFFSNKIQTKLKILE